MMPREEPTASALPHSAESCPSLWMTQASKGRPGGRGVVNPTQATCFGRFAKRPHLHTQKESAIHFFAP